MEWRGQDVDTPNWWWELEMIPDVDDVQELVWKIWASFELPIGWVSCTVLKIITLPHQHPIVSAKRISSHCQIWGSLAGTSGRNSERRLWPMPRLCNAGLKRPICLCQVNHAFWQSLSWNYVRWCNSMFHFWMISSWAVWPYKRGSSEVRPLLMFHLKR